MPLHDRVRLTCLRVLAVGLMVALPRQVGAEDLDIKQLQSRIYSAVDKVLPAVVAIADRRGSVFSGVIVSDDGLVLSAGHAVRSNRSYTVLMADGRRLSAKGLGVNKRVDMAMLRILKPDKLPVAEMGQSSVLIRNQPCISISFPGRYNSKRGAVVRFGYINKPITSNQGMIETTAQMEPGDSGGPLLDLDGKVIGIHSNIRRSVAQNYDVPIDSFRQYWDELKEPKEFAIGGWPSLPKLGFRGEDDDDGIRVVKVYKDGLAESSGLKVDDVITDVSGKKVTSRTKIYDRLIELRSSGMNSIELTVIRAGKTARVRIKLSNEDHPKPAAFPEIRNLARKFKELESKLDNVQFVVHSSINGNKARAWATRVYRSGRGNVVSKSTLIGDDARLELDDGSMVDAEVIARDTKNDLVLLHANFIGVGGVDLENVKGDLEERPGRLLLIPDASGEGRVSVWGSRYFSVPRTRASGGYLGVLLGSDSESGNVVFDRVDSGGARSAGIKSGDVLLSMNDKEVKRQNDVRAFLSQQEPNSIIKLVIQRDDAELVKEVVLGNPPDDTGHVADNLKGGKSDRRDGFSLAISHDADLRPSQCGGPVFDIDGNFLGINISRFSRTRCYVIPRSILKQFVANAGR